MKNMFKKFIENGKKYVDYIMKVNFGELFVNVVVLLCLLLLSALAFVPIELVRDIIRSLIVIYVQFDGTISLLFNWVFYVFSSIMFFISFMFLFNKRFEDLDAFKKQASGEESKAKREALKQEEKSSKEDEDLDLPKPKE